MRPQTSSKVDVLPRGQRRVYDFLAAFIRHRGHGPTLREICAALEIASTNGVKCHLDAMESKGLIAREPKKSRSIRLIDAKTNGLPFFGVVAGGLTSLADLGTLDMSEIVSGDCFAIQIVGQSLIEAAICDGDWLVITRQRAAAPGQLALVRIGEDYTVKYWHPERGRVRLQPANSSMGPIYSENPVVVGVVSSVIRQVA